MAAPIQNIRDFPYFVLNFIYVTWDPDPVNIQNLTSTSFASTNKTVKYQLQLHESEKANWQAFADQHFRGNLARMIRTLVTHGMVNGIDDNDLPEEISKVLQTIEKNAEKTQEKVSSFEDDLTIIKSLLSKLLQQQSAVTMSYQTGYSVPVEEIVRSRVYEYISSKEEAVSVESVLHYLNDTSVEATRWLAQEDQKIPAGGKIALAFMVEEVLKELYETTGNEAYNVQKTGRWEKYDF